MVHRVFHIGDLELNAFSDGTLKTSLDFVLGMERAQCEKLVGGTSDGSISIPVNNFLFRRDGATVLIDTGAGNTMQPTLGKLPANLKAAGIDPADITHIVLTHLHPDHANGLVDDKGEAIYQNAELLVHARELDFWMAENEAAQSDAVKRTRARNKINLQPYRSCIRRMRDGEEVLGCTPILAAGHSPGHTCWRIDTGRHAFIAWGDLVHFAAIQIAHPATAVKYDLDPDEARRSRLRMFDMIAADGLAIACAHVAAPGFGYLRRSGASYNFEPA